MVIEVQAIIESSIHQLGAECHQIAKDHGFWPEEGRNDGELVALIHSEASELLEAVRHSNPPSDHLPVPFTLAEEECADIIRVLDMAHARRWNVGKAVLAKLRFNRERAFKHGKAF
jgi:hypothetical protein